jgi:hypothetical protein
MEKYLLVKEDAYGMTCVTRTINQQINKSPNQKSTNQSRFA